VDEVALEQIFLRVLRFSAVSIIPPMLHTHLHLRCYQDTRAKREYFPESNALPEVGELRLLSWSLKG
jgi:hypothetical protein